MVKNRSVPTDTVLPHLIYRDVAQALDWLAAAFGFVEHYRYGPPDSPQGAQAHLGDAWVMLELARGRKTPAELGQGTQYLSVFVVDVEAHYAWAKAAGARIVEELNDTVYGERQYVAEDLDGHAWLFSQHIRHLDSADWGAHVAAR
ncbi:MAG TPA: VOC family protein [Chloroflexia bacterium]|nr:VOC family protein [Chloroflexia bacterium]